MPRRQVHTTINGVQYLLTQLGGNTIAELGDTIHGSLHGYSIAVSRVLAEKLACGNYSG